VVVFMMVVQSSLLVLLLLCVCQALGVTTFQNPVVNTDAPDPGVLFYNGLWYMVTTGCSGSSCYPIRRSKDLAHWDQIGFVFGESTLPSWAVGDFWAPELHVINGRVNCYFSARHTNGLLTIGGATAKSPEGPFTAFANPVMSMDFSVIDVNVAYEEGSNKPYLVWKVETDATPILCAELNEDGSATVGNPVELIRVNQQWEGPLVEGPWIIYHAPYYYLFYSGNPYNTPNYAVGVARSKSLTGPYEKAATPVMSQIADGAPSHMFTGPGHCSVVHVPDTGADVMVYHSWLAGKVGQAPGRVVLADRVYWGEDLWPYVGTAGTPSQVTLPVPNSVEFANMPPDVRLYPNGRAINLQTSQWDGNCWSTTCDIGGSCADKIIKVVPGLAGGATVSLQSASNSAMYFRHRDGVLHLDENDGSDLFRFDASFTPVAGLVNGNLTSLHAVNYVEAFLRHKDGHILLEDWDGSNIMASDGSWVVIP